MRWLGVDGGGTKTTFSVFDEHMNQVATNNLPTCHIGQVGEEGMRDVLRSGIDWAVRDGCLGEAWGIGFGLAGYGNEHHSRASIESVCESVSNGHPYVLMSDLKAGCVAALGLEDGVVIVAGTGSAALGMRGGRELRCGGWGFQIGDEGSGWWMGRRLLEAFSRESDGRRPQAAVHRLVREHLSLENDYDLIALRRTTLAGRTEVAALAPLVFEAAADGDKEARRILNDAAVSDAEMAATIVSELFSDDPEVRTSYIGGTFRGGNGAILDLLRAGLLPQTCKLVPPAYGPDAGACLVLRDSIGRGGNDACHRPYERYEP
ncbi:N-acetylglucosamine kinase [Tractidigestivibacter sp.]|uniref:N-acetylglucosamine kinase n=1 Tax=Tractidigestivibacter sp. TaxID=2847320 RepID=UPI003FD8EB78